MYAQQTSPGQSKPRIRRLRIAASAACLLVSTVVLIAWMRNFWLADVFWTPLPGAGQLVTASAGGQMELSISYRSNLRFTSNWPTDSWGWQTYTASPNDIHDVVVPWKTVIRCRVARNGDFMVLLPHWLLVAATLLVAAVPWIRWSRRFTIRTMLVITTFVAVVLAIAVTAGE